MRIHILQIAGPSLYQLSYNDFDNQAKTFYLNKFASQSTKNHSQILPHT